MFRPLTVFLTSLALLATAAPAADSFVPFAIPHQQDEGSLIALPSAPIDAAARIRVQGQRFVVGDGPSAKEFRVWGVNMCFGADFPDQETARRIARRLAAAGVNSVRFHHMDTSNWPSGIWTDRTHTKLSEEALTRLDYFIDQLARNGVYANINLHVGRRITPALGLPTTSESYDKMINLFTPELIDKQKEYARDLLGRVNTVRKVRYADDPAVAFVEITNENSLFMWSAPRALPNLPDYYAALLRKQYAAWLKARYGSDDKLRQAWSAGAQPLGENLLADADMKLADDGEDRWRLEVHGQAKASAEPAGKGVARVKIDKVDDTSWHVQFRHGHVKLQKGKYYTVSFAVRADARPGKALGEIGSGATLNHEPWGDAGFYRGVRLTGDWKEHRFGFVASRTDDDCRVSFSMGQSSASAVELRNVSIRSGGREGLAASESIAAANILVYGPAETPARSADRYRFLAETEKKFFDGMYAFLKKDLGVKALVTGTIVFGPLGLYGQSGMDYIDGHSYWQHPRFPGRPWDSGNWLVEQQSMADRPERGTLQRLACESLAGKPFTVSEYNHPAPLDSQAETVPMIASYAAAQGWSGVWLFAYNHNPNSSNAEQITGFFDIHSNPAKWGFMRAGAAIMNSPNALPPAPPVALCKADDPLAGLVELYQKYERGLDRAMADAVPDAAKLLFTRQVRMGLGGAGRPAGSDDITTRLSWTGSGKKDGAYLMISSSSLAAAGWAKHLSGANKALCEVVAPDFVALTITSLDTPSISDSKRVLVTACGRAENEGMGFSADRRTVGRNWGKAPVRIEAVEATLRVPGGQWRCRALTPAGTAAADVPLDKDENGRLLLRLHPRYKTMWYLLEK